MRPHSNRSLTAHLRDAGDHSRLPFHPECPVCRHDRLSGSLDGEEIVSRRTQAALAAGLLALSGVGVPNAFAQEPDEVVEGTVEVVVGDDPTMGADFDLDEETPQLPDEPSVAPESAPPLTDDYDTGPVAQEPTTTTPEPVVESTDDVLEPSAEPTPTPEPEPVPPPPAEAPAVPPPPSASEPGEIQAVAGETERYDRREPRRAHRMPPAQPRSEPSIAAPVPVAEPTTPPAATVQVVDRASGSRAAPGDRFHVVQPGESLWSIASDVLGERATVSRVAREVDRLWEMNVERIGTGRADLIYAGTRLTLR